MFMDIVLIYLMVAIFSFCNTYAIMYIVLSLAYAPVVLKHTDTLIRSNIIQPIYRFFRQRYLIFSR